MYYIMYIINKLFNGLLGVCRVGLTVPDAGYDGDQLGQGGSHSQKVFTTAIVRVDCAGNNFCLTSFVKCKRFVSWKALLIRRRRLQHSQVI